MGEDSLEESWRMNHGGGILGEESWQRNPARSPGREIMEGKSWERNHGIGIIGKESCERNPGRGIIEEFGRRNNDSEKHLRSIGGAFETHLRSI